MASERLLRPLLVVLVVVCHSLVFSLADRDAEEEDVHRSCSRHDRTASAADPTYPFQNVTLDWDSRVRDLVDRLNLDELVGQLSKGGTSPLSGPAPAIPRLGIKPYSWNTECLRGVVQAGPATSFPQSLGLAATFNRSVIFRVAEATSKEARAKYVNYTQHGEYGDHKGLSCFSPVINIMRHPLWGRNQETYGEDPHLSAELAEAFVKGLQGSDDRYIRTNAGCKHFDAHGGPENIPVSRFGFDAIVSERDWRLTYLPAFYGCIVKGGSHSVMCSYNRLNGVPACANKKLLIDLLRDEWKFTGYVISDQDALENIVEWHKWNKTMDEAAASALLAGTNLGLSTSNPESVYTFLPIAMQKRLVTFDQIKDAAKPLFYVRMRLGEFDPPEMNPFSKYSLDLIQSDEHRALSLSAAMQSIVLLHNRNGTLPLTGAFGAISVVGPMADNGPQQSGSYSPTYDPAYTTTPLKALKTVSEVVYYTDGCGGGGPRCTRYKPDDVKTVVQEGDTELIIVCLGTGQANEQEGFDRKEIGLPGKQGQMLRDVVANARPGVRVVVLLFNAGPVLLDADLNVDAILECFFPAQAAGEAIRRVLFNDGPHANPAARLPFTWPASEAQVPSMTDYSMANRTYRYWDPSRMGAPRFPFGFGLSYSTFVYSQLEVVGGGDVAVGDDVTFEVRVRNDGPHDGDEVVQAYVSWVDPAEPMPSLQLVAFERVRIADGDSYSWRHTLDASQLATYLDGKGFQQLPGQIKLFVGGQQPSHQSVSSGSSGNVLEATITVHAKQ